MYPILAVVLMSWIAVPNSFSSNMYIFLSGNDPRELTVRNNLHYLPVNSNRVRDKIPDHSSMLFHSFFDSANVPIPTYYQNFSLPTSLSNDTIINTEYFNKLFDSMIHCLPSRHYPQFLMQLLSSRPFDPVSIIQLVVFIMFLLLLASRISHLSSITNNTFTTTRRMPPRCLHDTLIMTTKQLLFILFSFSVMIVSGQTTTPTGQPSQQPTLEPTNQPSQQPSQQPTIEPTNQPSQQPSKQPSSLPSQQPSEQPTMRPSAQPSRQPSSGPTNQPSSVSDYCL